MNRLVAVIVVAVVMISFLGFTKPGHSMLASMGLVAAGNTDNGC